MRTVSLSGPRVPAAQGKAEYLVVLCHGYGADGNDLISLAPHWQRMLPKAAFVAPNAPERCAMEQCGLVAEVRDGVIVKVGPDRAHPDSERKSTSRNSSH